MPADTAFFLLQQRGAGSRTALFNLLNIALGSGVLGFPAVYAQAGWLYATVFIASFAVIGAFSNTIMIRSASWYHVVSFHSVVREALGHCAGNAVAIAMVVYSFGGCAAFLVIIGDFLSPACMHCRAAMGWPSTSSAGEIDACSREFLIVAVGVAVVLPLSLRSTVTALGRAGSLAIVGICYLAAAVVWRALESFVNRGYNPPPGWQSVVGTAAGLAGPVGTVAWSFAVMLGVPSVFAELNTSSTDRKRTSKATYTSLQNDGEVPNEHVGANVAEGGDDDVIVQQAQIDDESNRIALMDSVIHRQATITAMFYVVVGMGGYLQFGDEAAGGGGSVLNLYGQSMSARADSIDGFEPDMVAERDLMIDMARVVVSAVVALSFPIIHFTSRLMLYDLCCTLMGTFAAVANNQTARVERIHLGGNEGINHDEPSERVPLAADSAQKVVSASNSTGKGEPPHQIMTCTTRWLLTLFFWFSCTAFALAGYELGFIFAVFGSTCSVSTLLFIPGLLLLDKSGPWHQAGYRQAKLFGWRHEYGGERWRRTVGHGMLLCGALACSISLLLIFELI